MTPAQASAPAVDVLYAAAVERLGDYIEHPSTTHLEWARESAGAFVQAARATGVDGHADLGAAFNAFMWAPPATPAALREARRLRAVLHRHRP